MADVQYSHDVGAFDDDFEGQYAVETPPNALTKLANATGAVVSIALIVGIGVWGYKLLVRDVSGVPVVRAAAGEMRVRPEEPGGQLAQHQGLSVNAVAADGMAEKPADRLVLAPRPLDLADEDQPIAVAPVQQPRALKPAADVADQEGGTNVTRVAAALQSGSVDDLVAELTNGVDAIEADPEDENAPDVVAETNADAGMAAALDAPGVRQSRRPRLRPASAPAVVIPASAPADQPVVDVDPASVAKGTRLVQLGAFDSAEVAREQWDKLEGRFSAYLEGKSRIVMRAESGGRIFYRLRAMGFEDLSDARRFCSALVAENADCIPVVTR